MCMNMQPVKLYNYQEDVYHQSHNPNDPYANYSVHDFMKVVNDIIDIVKNMDKSMLRSGMNINIPNTNAGANAETIKNENKKVYKDLHFSSTETQLLAAEEEYKNARFEKKDVNTWLDNASNLSSFGHRMLEWSVCPTCGKKVPWEPKEGVCSVSCAMYKIIDVITQKRSSGNITITKMTTLMDRVTELLNILVNLTTKVPGVMLHIDALPESYRQYCIKKVSWVFLKMRKMLNLVLIWKNDLLLRISDNIRNGIIPSALSGLFAWLQSALTVISTIKKAFNIAYNAAMQVIKKISFPYKVSGESIGFLFTPRSFLYYPGKLFLEVPMSGIQQMPNIRFSALQDSACGPIMSLITKMFPPIMNVEYFMPPKAFKVRAMLSDAGFKAILKFFRPIEFILHNGADYVPQWRYLSLKNPWFIIAQLIGVGPVARNTYAWPGFP